MTTIAWDGEYIVGDGQAQNGNEMIVNTNVKKVRRLKNGGHMGIAGSWAAGEAFEKWFNNEGDMPEGLAEFCIVYIDPNGKPWLYDNTAKSVLPAPKRGALGSGGTYAQAILDYGGSALEGVKIACKRDLCSGGKIISLRYND
jgi:ATP-dependent protease HslVU (ClpYQ) peptidase subunit